MITLAEFENLKQKVLTRLEKELPENLTYHSVAHTIDVFEKSEEIALKERITNHEDLLLLKTAALYHDNGFLEAYIGHEEKSCSIMFEQVNSSFSETELNMICGMIMATKIPQTPLNLLEQIICDADLDYLGREDFYPVSNFLRLEFFAYNIVKSEKEWEEKQILFFEKHHYFTETSNNKRNSEKQQRLSELKKQFNLQYGL